MHSHTAHMLQYYDYLTSRGVSNWGTEAAGHYSLKELTEKEFGYVDYVTDYGDDDFIPNIEKWLDALFVAPSFTPEQICTEWRYEALTAFHKQQYVW